ncbi:hypothetical protein O7626_36615 [Micromonospora sp. WMMD1102]|uniref:hypothetical protein n=1 Tax=Micromonospora sp. WMMD1102 TaxID=3016105 RepID=UPI00241502D8|nr:hypothetical protein [Micromonospora sp. WMMD1102]MDG4791357.1 hypothetical protein [Micromonospora sp. WMMD1102]
MSTSADGDGRPDNGPFDGVPDLPAEWGRIVIPDDPAELAAESAQVRRELRLRGRRDGWRRRLGLRTDTTGPAPLRLCLMIMTVAVLTTLASLFAITWPNPQRPVGTGRSTPGTPGSSGNADSSGTPGNAGNGDTGNPGNPGSPGGSTGPTSLGGPTAPAGRSLPALDLMGEDGRLVPLRGLLPAVIILIDGCTCEEHLDAAVRAVPPGVGVLAVSTRRTVPGVRTVPAPGGGTPRFLTDPTAELRTALRLPAPNGRPSAVLADRSGQVLRAVPELGSAGDYQADLRRLVTTP